MAFLSLSKLLRLQGWSWGSTCASNVHRLPTSCPSWSSNYTGPSEDACTEQRALHLSSPTEYQLQLSQIQRVDTIHAPRVATDGGSSSNAFSEVT